MTTMRCMMFWLLVSLPFWGTSSLPINPKHIETQCKFATYPPLCLQTLNQFGLTHIDDVVSALVNKTILETKLPSSYFFAKFSSQLVFNQHRHFQDVTDYCETLASMSLKRLDQSLSAIKIHGSKKKHDIQTWISAAITFQQSCKDSVDSLSLADTATAHQISRKMDYLSRLSSNALSMANRMSRIINNNNNYSDGGKFPRWVSGRDRNLLEANTVKANVVVAKDGTGNFQTVKEAMDAADGKKRFVIYVKAGVYKEKIHSNKDGITLIGDGKYSTIIVGDDSVAGGSTMPGSATITMTGDGFIARDIGFQNTAGPQGEQALALNIASDHSVLYRCSIAGYQDTLYAHALRQFYRECDIYGTVDFIFGNAAAVFQNCYLVLRLPRKKGYNVILANGRSDPGQNTGFSVHNCRIVPSSEFSPVKHKYESYLGRPWMKYSRSVVMASIIDDAIAGKGWIEWPGEKSYISSLYFAEYSNSGPGAGTSGRVRWPGFHVIGDEEAVKFTVGNFISGSSWLPSTGVKFVSGLQ
ncbi:pectinesterase [Carica papaya]|uniref:pectinesterase n=1 Tax=Carica papaya TaxID=3649 RepID=UPI000B8C930A|nr:pectinesterase [Carica papaya]